VLKKFSASAKMLDDLIFKLETNLGKAHTPSPFPRIYNKYGFSSINNEQ